MIRVLKALVLALLVSLQPTHSALAADAQLLVTASVLDKNLCTFSVLSATLDFGGLDPTSNVDVTSSAGLSLRCTGSTAVSMVQLTHDSGLYEVSPVASRLRNVATGNYLPYALNLVPMTAAVPRDTNTPITITGTVRAADYRVAQSGQYSDTISVSVSP